MIFIFDTDVFTLSEYVDSDVCRQIHAHILELPPGDTIATTIITYEEQTRGWMAFAARSRDISHRINACRRLQSHLNNYRKWNVLEFGAFAADNFRRLASLRLGLGRHDLEIAAITLSRSGTLITRNLQHFTQVPGLKVLDWTAP